MKFIYCYYLLTFSLLSFSQKKDEYFPISQMTKTEKEMYEILQKSVNQLKGNNNTKLFPCYKTSENDNFFFFSSLIYDEPNYTNWQKQAPSSTYSVELHFSKFKKNEILVESNGGYGSDSGNEYKKRESKIEYHLIINYKEQIHSSDEKTILYLKKGTPFFENYSYDTKFYKIPLQKNHINTSIYNLDEKEMISYIDNNIYITRRNFKYGLLNNKNQIILPFKYDFIGKFKYGILVKENDLNYFVNNKGEKISPDYNDVQINFSGDYSSLPDCFKAKIRDKYTLINNSFQQILPLIYDSIDIFNHKNQPNRLLLKRDGKQVIFDITQWKETNIIYDNIEALNYDIYIVKENNKYGIIEIPNKILLPVEYDKISLLDFDSNNQIYLTIEKNDKQAIYTNNKFITKFEFDSISKFPNAFKIEKSDKFGLISKNGIEIIPIIYDSIQVNKTLKKIEAVKKSTIEYYDFSILGKI